MFAALLRFALREGTPQGQYSRATLFFAGLSGLLTTILGIALVFFPAQQITSLWSYELWMFGGTAFFVGLAAFFFFCLRSSQDGTEDSSGCNSDASTGERNSPLMLIGF